MINQKKSQLQSAQEIEFLGLLVSPNTMTLALPPDKLTAINSLCQKYLTTHQLTILELTQLLGKLSFSAQAVLSGRL